MHKRKKMGKKKNKNYCVSFFLSERERQKEKKKEEGKAKTKKKGKTQKNKEFLVFCVVKVWIEGFMSYLRWRAHKWALSFV